MVRLARSHNASHALSPARRLLVALLAMLALGVFGCAARIDPTRRIVRHLRFHGVHQTSDGNLRERIATRETSYFLNTVRLPWVDVEYYDPTTFRRDLERVVRYYQAQGYYSASVQAARIARHEDGSQLVDIDVTLREGPPTQVGTVWLSGCEPESIRAEDRWRLTAETCARIRDRMQLRIGATFAESAFNADRQLIVDLLREQGHATARVTSRATVDPVGRRAHVVFVLEPGPTAVFGDITVYEDPRATPITEDVMPSGLPVRPVIRAMRIHRGDPYNVSALAEAQRLVFGLGVFGIVRIDERPVRCDSQRRCGDQRDRTDPGGSVRVDIEVHLSPTRFFVWRVGGGFEADQSRSNLHLLGSIEHRNLNFGPFGRMWRLRIDERPSFYFGSIFGGASQVVNGVNNFPFGNVLAIELRRPELWRSGTGILSTQWDLGPDPINPTLAFRNSVRVAAGAQHRFNREFVGSAFLRWTWLDYSIGASPMLMNDPIWRQQYINQTYAYLDTQVTWDRRDNPLQTRRGTYLSAQLQGSFRAPFFGDYTFLRGAVDFRGYVNLGAGFVIAARGSFGAVAGVHEPDQWPVPQELRFFSGGANSNRGYPFYRVGYLTTVPEQRCTTPPAPGTRCTSGIEEYRQEREGGVPDPFRLNAVGGLLNWEFSAELRWYAGSFGVAIFFDSSDVRGWTPGPMVQGTTRTFDFGFDPHPSTGIGLRYVSPIGVVRLDLGIRLDDVGCSDFDVAALNQNRARVPGDFIYALPRPQCDSIFGWQIPTAFHFAIGEAY